MRNSSGIQPFFPRSQEKADPPDNSNMASEDNASVQPSPDRNSEVSGNLDGLMQLMSQMPNKTDLQNWGTDLKHAIHAETAVLQQEIAVVRVTLEDLEGRITHNDTATDLNTKILLKHDQAILDLRRHTDNLKNRSRRCNIRIRGVPESVPIEELHDMALKLFLEVLNVTEPPTIEDILCCLACFEIKEQILQKARTIDGIHFEDNVINLYQDLSASTIMQRRLLKPLTLVLREQSISFKWGFPFALMAHKGGKTFALRYPSEDILQFCQQLDIRPIELQDWRNYVLGTEEDKPLSSNQAALANQNPRLDVTPPRHWRKCLNNFSQTRTVNLRNSLHESRSYDRLWDQLYLALFFKLLFVAVTQT
ncbi:hypothetical protein XELAEV_18014815mg [Xenopus laevis]|uniref:Uncharacterized protein n=1 Tax=Xenopus laevis TaxID=8355 RepID=A0A974DHY9_XENLA|nr:hypothetical protein XELAEV_18014815mg [Xenopus laevis]